MRLVKPTVGADAMHEILGQIAQAAAIGVCGYIAHSVTRLNTKVAVLVEKIEDIADGIKDHEERVRELENASRQLN